MTLSLKILLAIIIAAILHARAFSQESDSVRVLYNAGQSLATSNPDKAFSLLQKVVSISQREKNWNVYLKSINALATLDFRERPELEEHVFKLTTASVPILKDMQITDELAQFHFNLAKFYSDLTSNAEGAIRNFEKAKSIWSSLNGQRSKEVADCYHGLGDIYKYATFDFNSAEKCYEMALRIRQEIKFNDRVVLYRNYYSLAATNRSQDDFEKALSYGNKAMEIVRQLEPYRQEQCAAMVANIYRDVGNSELAKKNYFHALRLNQMTGDLDNRAWYYLCLGETFKNDSLTNQALYYFRKAYDLYSTPGVRDQALFLSLLIHVIDIYAQHGEQEVGPYERSGAGTDQFQFDTLVDEIFAELRTSNMLKSTEAATVWLIMGKHHRSRMQYDSALRCYQRALIASVPSFESNDIFDNPTETMIGFKYYVNEILTQKAFVLKRVFETNHQKEYLNNILTCLELAETLLSKQRNTLDMEDSKWLFTDHNFDLYENIVETLYEARGGWGEDSVNLLAFKYFERSKARSLADALAMTEKNQQIGNEDSLFRVQSILKRKLFSTQAQINRGLENSLNPSELSALRNEIVELDLQIQAIKMAIEDKYPGYFNAMYGFKGATLWQVQNILKKHDQVLLEYFWGSQSVYGLGIANEKILFQRIGAPDSVKHLVNVVLSYLSKEGKSADLTRYREYTEAAHQLNEILVSPFMELLTDKTRIQIIPDGSINQLPFEMLLEEMPQKDIVDYRGLKYLIKSFAIGYAYSSSMLTHAARKRIASPSILAMGHQSSLTIQGSGKLLSEIKGAEEELKALAQRFHSGKFFLGSDANEANFKTFAPEFDIIHLAVHGSGDITKNFASSLYFGEPQKSEDGELHAYELYGLKLKAVMAVLSACESGLGKGYRGEGMVSMASAFTYSGCQNILMSLWKVNDQQSTKLMNDFYEFLSEGAPIDVALRRSKLKYLDTADELSADPKIWAPLVAYGNLDEIFWKDRTWIFLAVSVVFIFAMSFLAFHKLRGRPSKL